MIILLGFIPPLVSFLTTFLLIKKWIKIAKEKGFVGKDMNKYGDIYVPEAGGFYVLIGCIFGILSYIAIKVYILKTVYNLVEIFAILTILSLSSLLGIMDDLLGWKKGIKHYKKVLLTIPLSLPLVVIKAGCSKITLPFIGTVDVGLLYPLVLIPIGITGTAQGFNMLAGYNGLEALMGILLLSGVAVKSYLLGLYYITIICLLTISSILAFLHFNKYPAKVFPGNTFTFGIGALFGALVILGNFEKFGIALFSLYFIELLLFLRGLKDGIYKENFGKPLPDGSIDYEGKCYSLCHFAIKVIKKIKGKCYENDVVLFIGLLQTIITILALVIV